MFFVVDFVHINPFVYTSCIHWSSMYILLLKIQHCFTLETKHRFLFFPLIEFYKYHRPFLNCMYKVMKTANKGKYVCNYRKMIFLHKIYGQK